MLSLINWSMSCAVVESPTQFICERALKRAILHRKNALFYRTRRGARVGDMYMSLIYTCELCQANAFDYLTALHRRADQVADDPDGWMPWNYRASLDAASGRLALLPSRSVTFSR